MAINYTVIKEKVVLSKKSGRKNYYIQMGKEDGWEVVEVRVWKT